MTARRKLQPVEDVQEEEEVQPEVMPYDFELMTDDLKSRLNVWGNSTALTIMQIEGTYPEWARALRDMLGMLKNVAESMGE